MVLATGSGCTRCRLVHNGLVEPICKCGCHVGASGADRVELASKYIVEGTKR